MVVSAALLSNLFNQNPYRNDLINTLDSLLQKRTDIEYILVETNGLSEPSSLIKTFWLDDGLMSRVQYH